MRKALALFALVLLAFAGVAHADQFTWSEDFQGETLADYWQLQCDDYSDIGVVDDPADSASGNKVLMVDTWYDGGMAYANVLNSAVEGIDGNQEVTASFRFYLGDPDVWHFTVLGTMFTGIADYYGAEMGDLYDTGPDNGEYPFLIPAGEWVDFEFRFTPDAEAGVTTHKVYMNGDFMGEFENTPSALDEGTAFFVGDNEADGGNYGLAYWDDFQITGTARPIQDPAVPEPGSLLSLISGIAGLASSIFGLRKAGAH